MEEIKKDFVEKAREPFLLEKKKIEDEINSKYLQRTVARVGAEIIKDRYPKVSSADAFLVYGTAESHDRRMNYLHSKKWDKKQTEQEFEKELREEIANEKAKFLEFKRKFGLDDLDATEIIVTAAKQYKEEKREFILNGFMTKEEYKEFEGSVQNTRKFFSPIYDNKKLKKEEKEEISKAYLMLQESIKVELGDKYKKEHGAEFDYPANKKPFHSQKQTRHDSAVRLKEIKKSGLVEAYKYLKLDDEDIPLAVPPVEESRKTLEEVLEKYYKNKDPFENIDKMVAYTRRRLELAEKYRRGEVKFGPTPGHARLYISERKSEINKQMYQKTEPRVYQYAEKSADNISKKLAAQISGNDDAEDTIFTPAGCFIRLGDGSFETKPISPFDERIMATLDQNEAKVWKKVWGETRDNTVENIDRIDQSAFVGFVNRQFRNMAGTFSEAIEGGSFKQLQQLREELGFDITGLFGDDSKMNHFPTSKEIKILGEVMPGIMGFITKVNFNAIKEDGHHRINLDGLLSNLKASICGGGYSARNASLSDLVAIQDGGVTLNFFPYQTILYDTNYNHEKARSVLYSCLGYELMTTLDDEKIKEFANLLGERANISKQSIFRTYGIAVTNPLERRRIAIKTYFVSEFNKFAHGTADDKFKEYFNSLSSAK